MTTCNLPTLYKKDAWHRRRLEEVGGVAILLQIRKTQGYILQIGTFHVKSL